MSSQYFLFKNLIKGYHKSLVFLAYLRYFLYLYTYERASYGHTKSIARHDGRDAADAERVLDYVTQVISIPELKPVIKEIRHYVMVCRNCGERIRTAPRRRSNDVVYDSSVKALVVYLSVVQFLPYGRIASFLREVFGLTPSEGSLVNWVNEAKRNAQPVIDKIKEYIMSSAVVGFDESGLYCNKRLDWAWIAQTVYYTLLFRADGRGSKVLTDKLGDSLE